MNEEVLLTLNNEELYRVFIAKKRDLLKDSFISEEEVREVKHGVKIHFPLYKFFRYKDSQEYGLFRVKPKSNTINVDGKGHVDMNEFNDEVDERVGIMLNALMDYYNDDDDIIQRDLGELEDE